MKDPAALLYIDTWLTSTADMDADCRGWYMNLLLHQYDKKSLPNDIEKLAVLACVKFSEFERFKQVFEQVLKQKFKQTPEGRLENDRAAEIIRKRETFKEKRSVSGKMGYVIKFAKNEISKDTGFLDYIKLHINIDEIETNDKQVLKQVLKQMLKLYINVNEDGDVNKGENQLEERSQKFKESVYTFNDYPKHLLNDFISYWTEPNKSQTKMKFELRETWDTKRRLATWAQRDKKYQADKPRKLKITEGPTDRLDPKYMM